MRTKNQYRVLIALISILILLVLVMVLPPAGWLALGLLLSCVSIYWLSGVLTDAIDRVWKGR